jgi:two-component system response regulator
MHDAKILMVDDDPEELTLIEEALLAIGQRLHYAENGIEALEYLENCASLPCLIVLDLNMPKLNGSETLAMLKSHHRFKDIIVVIYSTSVNALEKNKCMKLGAHSYVMKPSTYADTLSTAKRFAELCALDAK